MYPSTAYHPTVTGMSCYVPVPDDDYPPQPPIDDDGSVAFNAVDLGSTSSAATSTDPQTRHVLEMSERTNNVAKKTVLYTPSQNGTNTAHYYTIEDDQKQKKLDDTYDAIFEVCAGGLGMPRGAENLRINFTRHLIYYTDPTDSQEHILSLEQVKEALEERIANVVPADKPHYQRMLALIDDAEYLIIVDIGEGEIRADQYDSHSAGVLQGECSLTRPNYVTDLPTEMGPKANAKALELLPDTIRGRAGVAKTAMSRMVAAEHMIGTIKVHLEAAKTALKAKQTELKTEGRALIEALKANPPPDAATQTDHRGRLREIKQQLDMINHDLDIVKERLKELEPIGDSGPFDPYVVNAVLTRCPEDLTLQEVQGAAQELTNQLNADYAQQRDRAQKPTRSWIPDVRLLRNFKNEELQPSRYPARLAGHMSAALSYAEGREFNIDYCQANGISIPQDRAEDAMIRMVMRGDDDRDMTVDRLLGSFYTPEMQDLCADLRDQLHEEAERMEGNYGADGVNFGAQQDDAANIQAFRDHVATLRPHVPPAPDIEIDFPAGGVGGGAPGRGGRGGPIGAGLMTDDDITDDDDQVVVDYDSE